MKIYSTNKFRLTLNGVSISNSNGPAINIQSSKRAFVVLADNTTNTLTDGASYAALVNGEDESRFFQRSIDLQREGSLSIQGNYKHAICSDDYVRIRSEHTGNGRCK